MRTRNAVVFVVFYLCLADTHATHATPTTRMRMRDLSLKIAEISPSLGRIRVDIVNASNRTLKVWNESNSWGSAHWRVLVMRGHRLDTLVQDPDEGFTRNIPAYTEVAAGAALRRVLDVNDGHWVRSTQQAIAFERGDTIIVIYDVPRSYGWAGAPLSVEASRMEVWYGVATAVKTIE
jgi:hypothetical protein